MKCIYTRINGIKVFSDDCKLWWVLRPFETKVYLFCGYTLKELTKKIKEIRGLSNVKKTCVKNSLYQKTKFTFSLLQKRLNSKNVTLPWPTRPGKARENTYRGGVAMYWYKEKDKDRIVSKVAWVEKQHSRKWLVLDCTGRIIKRFRTFRQASQYLASYGLEKRAVDNTYTRKYLFTN